MFYEIVAVIATLLIWSPHTSSGTRSDASLRTPGTVNHVHVTSHMDTIVKLIKRERRQAPDNLDYDDDLTGPTDDNSDGFDITSDLSEEAVEDPNIEDIIDNQEDVSDPEQLVSIAEFISKEHLSIDKFKPSVRYPYFYTLNLK